MNSRDLESKGAGHWVKFRLDSKDELLAAAPEAPGTYVIRKPAPFGRFVGQSDIVYIGSAEAGLRQRLRGYFEPGSSQATNPRIYAEMEKHADFELAFVAASSAGDAKSREREWLVQYKQDHRELPPLNRSMPGAVDD